jgi:trans-2,3-dihydro-3-hydroxyanthranilate isomerase
MVLDFYTLDVFTEQRLAGNPLAVVLDADALDAVRMQAIAREFNLAETVFVMKPANPAHSARVRIFTPMKELPFAGHPTVGAAVLLAELRAQGSGEREAIIVLEETVGNIRAGVRLRTGAASYAEFDVPRLPFDTGTAPPAERLAAALGLLPSEVGFANHRASQYSAGLAFTFVPVASLEAIARAEAQPQHWAAAFGSARTGMVYLYCRETVHTTSSFHARMFAPGAGIAEDPATGSAAAAFAGVIHRFDALPDGSHKRIIEQGYEMGRPSEITLALEADAGKLIAVRVGGSAVRVAEGRIGV